VYGNTIADVGPLACPRGGPVSLVASTSSAQVARLDDRGTRCLSVADVVDGAGVTCADSRIVSAQGLVGVMRAGVDGNGAEVPDSSTLYALPPRNAKRAILRRSNGATRRVDVRNGFLAVRIADDETILQWDAPTSPTVVP
jgi:hypothetical protein